MERPKKDEMLPHCKRAGPQEQGSDRPNLPAAPSMATMICRSALALARTPSSTASVAAGRCLRTRSTRSARGASRC